jgi:hypothetical protein
VKQCLYDVPAFCIWHRFTRIESIAPLKKHNDDRIPSVLCSDDIADTSTAFAGSSRYNSSLAMNDKSVLQ